MNNIKGITVEIGGDTGPLSKAMKDVDKVSRDLQSELREVNKQLKFDPQNTELLRQKQTLLTKEISNTKDRLVTLKEAEKQAQEQFKQGKIGEEQYRALQREVIKTESQLKSLEKQAAESNLMLSKISETAGKVSAASGKVADAMMPATLAIAGIGTAATKASMSFEDGIAKISTIADTTQMSLENIGDGVIALSNKTGKSVEDLNEGLYQAISSGVQTGETLQFMDTASKAAIGGFTETETAVDGLTTVLNAYGMKASEVNNIANQMMVTQNLGKTTFGELAQTVGNAIPTFSAANVSTKEFFSSMAVLTANGIKTSESVTGLKAALSNIIKPTVEAHKAAATLGLKFDAAALSTKGWMPFLQGVREKLKQAAPAYLEASDKVAMLTQKIEEQSKSGKKNSSSLKELKAELKSAQADMKSLQNASSGQLGAFGTMFGSVEGLNTVLTLTSDQGLKLYNESMKQMGSNTDYVNDAFNKVHNTSGNELKNSLTELKNSSIKLGEALTPIINQISQLIKGLAQNLAGLSKGQTDALVKVAIAVAIIAPIAKIIQGISGGVEKLIKVVQKLPNLIKGISSATKLLFASPHAMMIAAIVTTIALLVVEIKHLWDTNEGFRKAVLNIIASIQQAWNGLMTFFSGIPAWWNALWTQVGQFFTDCWNGIISFFTTTIPAWIQSVIQWFQKLPYNIGLAMGTALANIVNFGVSAWQWVTTELPKIITGIINWFGQLPGKIWAFLVDIVNKIGQWGANMVAKAAVEVPKFVNKVIEFIRELPGKIWTFLADVVTKVVQWAGNLVTTAQTEIPKFCKSVVGFIGELPKNMLDIGGNIVKGIWDGINGAVDWLHDRIKGFCDGVVDDFKKNLKIHSPSRLFADVVGKNIALGIGQGFTENMKSVVASMTAAIPTSFDTGVQVRTAMAAAYGVDTVSPRLGMENGTGQALPNGNEIVINQHNEIHSPKALSYSEISRNQRYANQRLVLSLRKA